MTFLVNDTQLVECPLLVLFNFEDCTGISEHASRRILRWFRVLWLSLNPRSQSPPFTLCLPSWAPSYLRSLGFSTPALHSSLTSPQAPSPLEPPFLLQL